MAPWPDRKQSKDRQEGQPRQRNRSWIYCRPGPAFRAVPICADAGPLRNYNRRRHGIMAIKTEKELSGIQRTHWLKADAAIGLRNFGYAISLLQGILKQEPEFLTGRRLLRSEEHTSELQSRLHLVCR